MVEVVGLRDFQRELRGIDKDFAKELKQASKQAAEIVAGGTYSALISYGGSSAKAAPSVKAFGQQRAGLVKIGGSRYPFAMGANFGSNKYKQFRKPTKPDYALYRTIAAKNDQIIEVYGDALDKVAKKAFPD